MTVRSRTLVARKLRREATDVERLFWRALRERCPQWKFRRQHPIGRRIADFACPAQKLVVELDGSQHSENELADHLRTMELSKHGYRVIRFWNSEVLENIEGVLETILRALESAPPHPNPLRPRGAEREMNSLSSTRES